MSKFLNTIAERAKQNKKKIVLAEGNDIRVIRAAAMVLEQGIADIVLLGDEAEIKKTADSENLNIKGAEIINPLNAANAANLANTFYEIRKAKGITEDAAAETLKNVLYYGVMMVKTGLADGMVAGAVNSTSDVLRPSLQVLKTAPGVKLVSSFFVMVVPNCEYGENGLFIYSDSGLNENPDAEALSEIAISSARSFQTLVNAQPKIAMLSYSTYGSAKSPLVEKVQNATKIAKEKAPHLKIDGEMQLDAAVVPDVGRAKAPDSEIAGSANVLIFPDLNSGNIGYKLTERLAGADAYGPITQGIAKPVNDLSRGCSAEDIVGVVAITCVQAQDMEVK